MMKDNTSKAIHHKPNIGIDRYQCTEIKPHRRSHHTKQDRSKGVHERSI